MTEIITLDSPRLHISPDLLRNPPAGVTIDWSRAEGKISGRCLIVTAHRLCGETCMKGVLVKVSYPVQRVWKLTGEVITRELPDGVSHILGYEGIWPD